MNIVNRKFGRDFEASEEFEAGVVLTGAEVKSIRAGKLKLEDSYVKFIQGEPYLINAEIYPYQYAPADSQQSKRSRKILLRKDEILKINTKIRGASGLTMVPVSCYNKGSLIKLKIAVVRGRRDLEKRKREKGRDIARNERREAKEYTKR
jgi:SsrA-binding protein